MIEKIFYYFKKIFRTECLVDVQEQVDNELIAVNVDKEQIPTNEDDDIFDENGFIKSQDALDRWKKKLKEEWLNEMPKILCEYRETNKSIFQKFKEAPVSFQIHDHIFDFFDNSNVLLLDGQEIDYCNIQKVSFDWMTVSGPNHRWTDSYPTIKIELKHGMPLNIHVQYDPYKVLHSLKEKLSNIANYNY